MTEEFKRYINMTDNGDGTMTVVICLEEDDEVTILCMTGFDEMLSSMTPEDQDRSHRIVGEWIAIPNEVEA